MNKRVLRSLIFSACWIGQSYASMPKLEYVKGAVSDVAQWTVDSARQLGSVCPVVLSAVVEKVRAFGGYMVIIPQFSPQEENDSEVLPDLDNMPAPRLHYGCEELEESLGASAIQEVFLRSHVGFLESIQAQEMVLKLIKDQAIAADFEKLLVVAKVLGSADTFIKRGCYLVYYYVGSEKINAVYWVHWSTHTRVPFYNFSKIDQEGASNFYSLINKCLLAGCGRTKPAGSLNVEAFVQSLLGRKLQEGEQLTTELLFARMDEVAAMDKN